MVSQVINNCSAAVQDLINETVGGTIACCGATAYRLISKYHTPEQGIANLAYQGHLGRFAAIREKIARFAKQFFAEPLPMLCLQFLAPAVIVLSTIAIYELVSLGSEPTSRSTELYSACSVSSGVEAAYLIGKLFNAGLVAASRAYIIGSIFAIIHSSYCSYRSRAVP